MPSPFPIFFTGPATPPNCHNLDQQEVSAAFACARRIGCAEGELWLRQLRERQVMSDITAESFAAEVAALPAGK